MRRALLLACSLALSSAALPTFAACGIAADGVDFSSVASTNFKGVGTDSSGQQYNYYLNLCGPVQALPQCSQQATSTSACQEAQDGTSGVNDIGNWLDSAPPAMSWTDAKQSAVTYTMSGAQKCWQQGSPTLVPYTTTVTVTCGTAASALQAVSNGCVNTLSLTHPLACPHSAPSGDHPDGGKKHSLSGGWIFVIILSVVLPLYVLGGCLYKSQKLGATGMDKCPNVEFWRDLPSLVKDGCAFCYGKLRGLCGGKAAGSNYETM